MIKFDKLIIDILVCHIIRIDKVEEADYKSNIITFRIYFENYLITSANQIIFIGDLRIVCRSLLLTNNIFLQSDIRKLRLSEYEQYEKLIKTVLRL